MRSKHKEEEEEEEDEEEEEEDDDDDGPQTPMKEQCAFVVASVCKQMRCWQTCIHKQHSVQFAFFWLEPKGRLRSHL